MRRLLTVGGQLAVVAWLLLVYWQFDRSFAGNGGRVQFGGFDYTSGTLNLTKYTLSTGNPGALFFILQGPTFGGLASTLLDLLIGLALGWLATTVGLVGLVGLRLPLRSSHPLTVVALTGGLGLTVVYFVHALLTFAHLLQPWFVYPLNALAVGLAVGWWWHRREAVGWWWVRLRQSVTDWRRALRQPQQHIASLLLLLAATVAAVTALASALAPPVLWDTLYYHLSLPQAYARAGGYTFVHNSYFPIFQQGAEAIFLWPISLLGADNLRGGVAATWLHWLMTLFTAMAIYSLARELGWRRLLALGAATFYIVTPLVGREAGTAYVDNATTFFALLCIYSLWRWWQGRMAGWLWLAGVLAGAAIATKLYAIFLLPVIGGLVLAAGWQAWRSAGRTLLTGAAVLLVAGLVASPWYIASWLELGNPFWPSFNSLFHGKYWGELAETNLQYGIANYSRRDGIGDFNPFNLTKYLLWDISLNNSGPLPRGGQFAPRTLPAITALLPLAVLGWRRLPGLLRVLVVGTAAYIVFWAAAQGIARYVLPVFPLLALLAAWAWGELRRWRLAYVAVGIFLTLTLFAGSLSNLIFNARAFPYLYGRLETSEYITSTAINRLGDDGWVARYISRRTAPDATILYARISPFYYTNRNYLATDPVVDNLLDYPSLKSAADFKVVLTRLGVDYLFFNPQHSSTIAAALEWGATGAGRDRYSHLEYVRGVSYLYKVDAGPLNISLPALPTNSRLGLLGWGGATVNPPSGVTVVNLDGLERLLNIGGIDYLLVNSQPPAQPPVAAEDVGALIAPPVGSVETAVSSVVSPTATTSGRLYDLRSKQVAVEAALQIQAVPGGSWRLTEGEERGAATLPAGLSLPLGEPQAFSGERPPDVEAVAVSDFNRDLVGSDVLAIRLTTTPGSTLHIEATIDGQTVSLLRDYHNVGGPETLFVQLKGSRLNDLRLRLVGPQGGTGNLRAGRLDQQGGSHEVTAEVQSLTLLRMSELWRGR